MKNLGYYNGVFDEIENMQIPMNDRVCYFGDGVYDATYSRNYKIYELNEHIDRLYRSASLLRIEIAQTKEEMKEILNEMVNKMDTGENFVYWQVTRGTGKRNHVFPEEGKANLWINILFLSKCKYVYMYFVKFVKNLQCNLHDNIIAYIPISYSGTQLYSMH